MRLIGWNRIIKRAMNAQCALNHIGDFFFILHEYEYTYEFAKKTKGLCYDKNNLEICIYKNKIRENIFAYVQQITIESRLLYMNICIEYKSINKMFRDKKLMIICHYEFLCCLYCLLLYNFLCYSYFPLLQHQF